MQLQLLPFAYHETLPMLQGSRPVIEFGAAVRPWLCKLIVHAFPYRVLSCHVATLLLRVRPSVGKILRSIRFPSANCGQFLVSEIDEE